VSVSDKGGSISVPIGEMAWHFEVTVGAALDLRDHEQKLVLSQLDPDHQSLELASRDRLLGPAGRRAL
jgi:hypothetical protein